MFLELQSTNTAHQHVASLAKMKNPAKSDDFDLNFGYGRVSYHKIHTPRSPSSPAKTRRLEPPRRGPKKWFGGVSPKNVMILICGNHIP